MFNKKFPLIKQSIKKQRKKWITPELIKILNNKNSLYKKWVLSRSLNDKVAYSIYKKFAAKLVSEVKRNYFLKIFNSRVHSNKEIWKSINNLISLNPEKYRTNPNLISKICINGKMSFDPSLMASHFNSYFCNIGAELAKKVLSPLDNSSYKNFLGPSISNSFVCNEITYSEIFNKINNQQK